MNKNTAKDYLPLVQALADGKVIQLKYCNEDWHSIDDPSFDLPAEAYRIKPEPREVWVNRRSDGLEGTCAYTSEADAAEGLLRDWTTIRYREVLE